MEKIVVREGRARWYMNSQQWTPSEEEWQAALNLLTAEEKAKVLRFLRMEDRKRAFCSRLMQRLLIYHLFGLKWTDIVFKRTKEDKPFWEMPPHIQDRFNWPLFNFNVTHHGDHVALASEVDSLVGIDIMSIDTQPRGSKNIEEFFSIFKDNFTANEWTVINSSSDVTERYRQFYIHWALKESYIKAVGIGLGFELQRSEFSYVTDANGRPVETCNGLLKAQVKIDGLYKDNWSFFVHCIDPMHVIAVAFGDPREAHGSFRDTLFPQGLPLHIDNERFQTAVRREDDLRFEPLDVREVVSELIMLIGTDNVTIHA
eukprot:GILK01012748.1.p1 GENE.GILK01012748.1~~GILK01012748.1.p1  ORF type:complete len:315 (-),score=53.15 GILK01012748.1:131-1075(-)